MPGAFHPAWAHLSWAAKALHTRNALQVLGSDLANPSRFVLCWTRDGAESAQETSVKTGGTRTAIVIACRDGVPVINMRRPDGMQRLGTLIRAHTSEAQGGASVLAGRA